MKKILSLLTLFAISQSCLAQNASWTGTVQTSCTFSNQVDGTLNNWDFGGTYYLDATANSRAHVDIAYVGSPNFTIAAVSGWTTRPNNTPTTQFTTGIGFTNAGNNTNADNVNAGGFSVGVKTFNLDSQYSSDTAYISLIAQASNRFPVGSYGAETVITCQ